MTKALVTIRSFDLDRMDTTKTGSMYLRAHGFWMRTVAHLLVVVCVFASAVGCRRDRVDPPHALPDGGPYATTIHASPKLTSVALPTADGGVERLACVACHTLKKPKALPRAADELHEFHRGLTFRHGDVTCAHCHVDGARSHDTVHLANGELVPMAEAIRLCVQCHGPQFRDYSRGSHGGMEGAFSPVYGPRTRNHCVDCHDPHAPKFQGGKPVLPPRDRGTLTSLGAHHE